MTVLQPCTGDSRSLNRSMRVSRQAFKPSIDVAEYDGEVPQVGSSGAPRLLPHERWVIARVRRRRLVIRDVSNSSSSLREQTYRDAAMANLRICLIACGIVLVTVVVMIGVIHMRHGPLSTTRDPDLGWSIAFACIFWLVALIGIVALALEIVRTIQWMSAAQSNKRSL